MAFVTSIVLIGLLAFAGARVQLLRTDSPQKIAGEYIFVFNSQVDKQTKENHLKEVMKHAAVSHVYEFEQFSGYAAAVNDSYLAILRQYDDIYTFIEANQIVTASQCNIQGDAVWGLNRISDRELDLDEEFHYQGSGEGVTAYIVDTGINLKHVEFTGRVSSGINTVNAGKSADDDNGHGTHVAGTVGGTTFGVAKKVTLVAVKVLGGDGSGSSATVVAGVNFVAKEGKGKLSVANLSLGGSYSPTINTAVANAVAAGITFIVAAGNEDQDACNTSPASEPSVISVGATTVIAVGNKPQDARASYSNWGKCVDILAPGSLIESAWIGSSDATLTISGTSMASPHVAGAAAVFLAQNPKSKPSDVAAKLVGGATEGMVALGCGSDAACNQTPNLLLYSGC